MSGFLYAWRRFSGLPRLRALYWIVLRRWDAEICSCGRPVRLVWWCHDDFLWEKVTGKAKPVGSRESAAGILCIQCFDIAAKEVCPWIEWAPLNLRHLQSPDEEERSAAARWQVTPATPQGEEGGRG